MPTQSVLIRDSSFLTRVLQQYLSLLKNYPIITKSVTSGILSALGNLLSQGLEYRKSNKENSPKKEINVLGPVHFAIFGLFITGPASHYFYHLLEVLFPNTVPYCLIKRLLLERLIFAPAFLLLFYVVMNALEVMFHRFFSLLYKKICFLKNSSTILLHFCICLLLPHFLGNNFVVITVINMLFYHLLSSIEKLVASTVRWVKQVCEFHNSVEHEAAGLFVTHRCRL